jgi:hypothetical protein
MRFLIKFVTFVLFMGALVFPIYAFASTNASMGASGEGAASISGWAVSNINYSLSQETAFVTSVAFDLDAPAKNVSIKLVSSASEFATCWNVGNYHWQCDLQSGIQVASMDEFRVIAVGN